ncbi:MAG: histidine kinase, partial [Bacteroidota bacterium]
MILLCLAGRSQAQIPALLDSISEQTDINEEKMLELCDSLLGTELSRDEQAYVYYHMSEAWYFLNDVRKSYEYTSRSLANMTSDFQPFKRVEILNNHGQNLNFLGEIDSAAFYYRKGLSLAKKVGDSVSVANLHHNLGVLYYQAVEIIPALQYFDSASSSMMALEDSIGISYSLRAVASIQMLYDDFEVAIKNLNRAADYVTADDISHRCVILYSFGNIALKQKNIAQAEEYVRQCRQCFQEVEDLNHLNYFYTLKGELAAYKGDTATAIIAMDSSYLLSVNVGDGITEINAYMFLQLYRGKVTDWETTNRYLKIAHEKKLRSVLWTAYKALHRTAMNAGEYQQAHIYRDSLDRIADGMDLQKNRLMLYAQSSRYDVLQKETELALANEKLKSERLNFIGYGLLLLFISLAVVLFLVYRQKKSRLLLREQQFNKEMTLKEEVLENESKALRAQMNPHFVYNCLTAIQAFILSKNEKRQIIASDYLSKFAVLTRQALEAA